MENMISKQIPDYLNDSVIYQIFPRAFTPQGTLKSAEKMLPHIKSIGADIVYLCPVCVADGDEDRTYWSTRQRTCGRENPKNPYRISDYFNVDSEYGTNEDLRDFIKAAHALGLRVILDLVYYHCGPKAVFLDEHPEFVVRDEEGKFIVGGCWLFPRLNYECKELREYLWSNMEYYVREFDCDGFRCDIGDLIPLDFWEEGRARIERIKPDVMMLNEGKRKGDQVKAFDVTYYFADVTVNGHGGIISTIRQKKNSVYFKEMYAKYMSEFVADGGLTLLNYDNHDYANDTQDKRYETDPGAEAVELALFYMYTMRGVPFLYNGCEVADARAHSIWANRFHAANMTIEWENALTEKGAKRIQLIKELNALRKSIPALSCRGDVAFYDCGNENVLSYVRTLGDERFLICLNLKPEPQAVRLPDTLSPLYAKGAERTNGAWNFAPFAYALFKQEK